MNSIIVAPNTFYIRLIKNKLLTKKAKTTSSVTRFFFFSGLFPAGSVKPKHAPGHVIIVY